MSAGKRLAVGATALVLAGVTACSSAAPAPVGAGSGSSSSSPSSSSPSPAPGATVPTPDHVMVVIFENEDAKNVVGSPDAPYLTSLASRGVTFTDAHGETHPSQPNYLALFSGSTQGVVDNSCPLTLSGPNLAAQLQDAGRTFIGYSEDLPAPGYTGCNAGDYARKHNPWVNFDNLPASVNQPYSALPADYADLPTVSFVVPNLCNDMHDCGVAAGDSWAAAHLPGYVSWAEQHNSLLVVTFDEDNGSSANHIATLLVGPMVEPGTSDQRVDHYNVLRTLEDMYGLPPLGEAAAAEPLSGVWTEPR
ncbi:MAG: acid phosphatase [Blastococcus sp.]|nr:acid phosphatase [Blastococcus sp.]